MKTMRMTILSLSALIIFLTASPSVAGPADVRIRAKVRTPLVRLNLNTGFTCGNVTVERHSYKKRSLRTTQKDRRIATRLSRYSGIPKYEILFMRDRGYRWSEIARYFELPRKVVRAAQSSRSWKKYQKPARWCRNH